MEKEAIEWFVRGKTSRELADEIALMKMHRTAGQVVTYRGINVDLLIDAFEKAMQEKNNEQT